MDIKYYLSVGISVIKMKYQLVLQFKTADQDYIEWLIAIEEDLNLTLGSGHVVDGFDVGQGEFNIFIHTNYPEEAFEKSKEAFFDADIQKMVAAYRKLSGDNYLVIWPKGYKKNFKIG